MDHNTWTPQVGTKPDDEECHLNTCFIWKKNTKETCEDLFIRSYFAQKKEEEKRTPDNDI